ncbi:transporter [Luteibacter yeojuensis]|uniref:Outer membrane beta-barrel porin/alpha-amylase n=1 Tax=Luteibacter yeojuensis TaxID=345309 RepID=A0A0F3KA71_9GAMM|nr:transporter [Luteibacter yeojuensis]KJV28108.1 hypothetical protein VI08_17245 [Luteibacter yeojuensis]
MPPRSLRPLAALVVLAPAAAMATTDRAAPLFTGPLVTPAVNTLPANTLNIEPYLIHTHVRGAYANDGGRHRHDITARQWMVALPMVYGVTDALDVQLTLNGSRTSRGGAHSDGLRMGDSVVRVLQRLAGPGPDGTDWVVGVAMAVRIPTGKYQRLDTNPFNGTGAGAMGLSTTLGAQKLQWLANGHALRWRGQLGWGDTPGRIGIHGASTYGTGPGFRGHARPGPSWTASLAAEYVLAARWGLVGEAIWNRGGATTVHGACGGAACSHTLRPTQQYSLAPAVAYHLGPTMGLIAGVQFSVAGRNAASYVAPQAAFNMVF